MQEASGAIMDVAIYPGSTVFHTSEYIKIYLKFVLENI